MTSAVLLGPGSVVGGEFAIRAPLEEGGMGAVYIAEQRSTGKLRAVKLMHREIVADPALHRRFEQETIQSSTFNDCVVGTLIGQTINAAGPDGKGHVVHAFRFVPN